MFNNDHSVRNPGKGGRDERREGSGERVETRKRPRLRGEGDVEMGQERWSKGVRRRDEPE